MKTISDLDINSEQLFIKRMKENVITSWEIIQGGLDTRIENMTDTLNVIGLAYDENGDKLYSHFELINDLSVIVGMEHNDFDSITEFDLQYADERNSLYEYLSEHDETYSLSYADTTVFNKIETGNLYDVLDTLNLLSQLNQDYQKMFIEIYQNSYTESPIDLVNTLITYLKDW